MNSQISTAVKSADRVLDLFELLAHSGRDLSHTEMSEALEIPKSSLTQLLRTLTGRNYLKYDPTGRNYCLGPRFTELTQASNLIDRLVALAEPLLVEISRKTGETSALNIRDGESIKVIASVNSVHRLASHMHLGDRAPLYATSSGRLLLSALSQAELDAYLSGIKLKRFTPASITSKTALKQALTAIRETGLGYVSEQFTHGIVGFAVPIFNASKEMIATLNVALPLIRDSANTRKIIEAALRKAALTLEKRLA